MNRSDQSAGTATGDSTATPAVDDQRRDFLKKSGTLTLTAPAVSLLLAASLVPEQARAAMYTYDPGIPDDLWK